MAELPGRRDHAVSPGAQGAGFEKVHPTATGGRRPFRRGPDLPPSGPSDGIESKFVKCVQCGFYIDTDVVTEGSGYGNTTSTGVGSTDAEGDYAVRNPSVGGGCPLCGSSNFKGDQ